MGTDDVHVVGGADRPRRVVLLHGHGGSPEAMLEVAVALSDGAPVQVELPRGPVTLADEEGWAWWEVGSACDPATVGAVRTLVTGDPRPTVLAGFSQGGAMALLTGATAPGAATGLAVVCGYVPDDVATIVDDVTLPPVLVLHGEEDEVVDPLHGRMVARWCERRRAAVTSSTYPGGHDWTPEATRRFVDWLAGLEPG